MKTIMAIAGRHGIVVIEDAAQAHGAEIDGKRAGTFGEIGCFSFYPGKNLGACGEGGAIVTNRPDLASTIRQLRDWGQAGKYNHERLGFNYRMDAVQGAVLNVKLRHLPEWIRRRQSVAALYDSGLEESGIVTPAKPRNGEHVYHVYAIRHEDRERLRSALSASGIATGVHYPRPVHLQPAFTDLGYGAGAFPVSETLARETLSLPIYPELGEAAVRSVCRALQSSVEVANAEVDAA
jgi:dTDP-4-amino-4,6-dideoxygalactose transaminase